MKSLVFSHQGLWSAFLKSETLPLTTSLAFMSIAGVALMATWTTVACLLMVRGLRSKNTVDVNVADDKRGVVVFKAFVGVAISGPKAGGDLKLCRLSWRPHSWVRLRAADSQGALAMTFLVVQACESSGQNNGLRYLVRSFDGSHRTSSQYCFDLSGVQSTFYASSILITSRTDTLQAP